MATQWYFGEVSSTDFIAPNTKLIRLTLPPEVDFQFTAGQFITLDLPVGEKRLNRWKSYSIANAPTDENYLELCVSKIEDGLGSTYLVDTLNVGDTLKFKGPEGTFILGDDNPNEIIMICTGTGVVPFRSILMDKLYRNQFNQKIHLIFGTRNKENILFQQDFESIKAKFPSFDYTIVLSRESDWEGAKGHVHNVYMEKYATKTEQRQFYLCGWSKMIDEAVVNIFLKLGYSRNQIIFELYGNNN